MGGVGGFGEVVGGHDDRAASAAFLGHDIEDALSTYDVETGHRFVEQENVASLSESLRHEDALTLATGEFMEMTARQITEFESIDGLVDDAPIVIGHPAEHAAHCEPAHCHHFADGHGELIVHLRRLHDITDVSTHLPGSAFLNREGPGFEGKEADDGVQQTGLARTVRADQRGHRTGREGEVGVAQHRMAAVGKRHVMAFDSNRVRRPHHISHDASRGSWLGRSEYDQAPRQSCPPGGERELMSRTARQMAAAITILLGVLVLGTGVASAHASVVTSSPTDGQSVATSPSEISVTFSENVSSISGGISVLGADGEAVPLGTSRIINGRTLLVEPEATLSDGTYVVTYRVLSADGHPVSGSLLFGVGSGALDRSARPDATEDRPWEIFGVIARSLMYLAALIATGVAFFLAFIHDHAADRWRIVPFVRIGAIVTVFGAIGIVMSQAALLTGKGVGAVTEPGVLRDVLAGNLGWSLALLMLGLAAVHLSTDITRTRASQVLALAGGSAVTVSFAMWGHATELPPRAVSLVADAVHVSAAALWFGGLIGLAMVLFLRSADSVESTAIILRRFSLMALISVLALASAGFILTLTGSNADLTAMTSTTWGRLVLAKIGLTAIVVATAAWNRRSLVPALLSPTTDPDVRSERWRTLRRSVRLEALILVVVIVITAIVVNVLPARNAVATSNGPVALTKQVTTGQVSLSINPAAVGPNRVQVQFTDGNGQPVAVANTMTLEFSQPSAGLEPITRQVPATSPGTFVLEGNELSIPGTWTVTVAVRTGDFTEQRTTFDIPITRSPPSLGVS